MRTPLPYLADRDNLSLRISRACEGLAGSRKAFKMALPMPRAWHFRS